MFFSNKPDEHQHISLASTIKRTITLRILVSLFILLTALFFFAFLNLSNSFKQIDKNIASQCTNLQEFTISQMLINNEKAVKINIQDINEKNPLIHFEWHAEKKLPTNGQLRWIFPLSWENYCPVKSKDGEHFGYFKVTGSVFYNHELIEELIVKTILLLSLSVIVFLLLYPLGNKIPQRIFFQPVMDLLHLLKEDWKTQIQDKTKSTNLPIEIQEIQEKLLQLLQAADEHSREIAFAQIATKVAHDIRSPLAALNMVLKKSSKTLPPEDNKIIQSATQRINDIANNLLSQKKINRSANAPFHPADPQLACVLLESLLSEKRAQYSDLPIEFSCSINETMYGIFINVNAEEFSRTLSNLINNAVEAITGEGKVTVSFTQINTQNVSFSLQDTGIGLSPEQLETILTHHTSIGKKDGSGIGLSSAIQSVANWKGQFSMKSTQGKGTCVTFTLPIAHQPSWFVSELWFPKGGAAVILDDDELIHHLWEKRLSPLNYPLLHFYSPEAFAEWYNGPTFPTDTLHVFLSDHEMPGSAFTGLTLIQALHLNSEATLITGRYDDTTLQKACQEAQIRLTAKPFASNIKLNIFNSNPDFIFIDDNVILTDAWQMQASLENKKILVFNTLSSVKQALHYVPKYTPIYIDSNLELPIKGEIFAKDLYEIGFTNIYLCTGNDESEFPEMSWIKAILGKEYPTF